MQPALLYNETICPAEHHPFCGCNKTSCSNVYAAKCCWS